MTTLEQAAQMALKALEVATTPLAKDRQEVLEAIAALRKALGQKQEFVRHEFQDRQGNWHPFVDEQHYLNTVEAGHWPIRALYRS